MRTKVLMTVLLVMAVTLLAGCKPVTAPAAAGAQQAAATPAATEAGSTSGQIGMPNPASVNCEQKGGKLEIRNEANGQVGYCVFSDGSECEEWAFMRGECVPGQQQSGAGTGSSAGASTTANMPNPASVNCEEKGGKLEIRKDASGGEYGMCLFTNGTECEEWAFLRGTCEPGHNKTEQATPTANMPNPASVNCVNQGGKLDIRKDASGGEYGMCVFPDNSECEEWALLRGTCKQGDIPSTK